MPRFYENHRLSKREQQVVDLAALGRTDQEIGHELGISESTVTTYWDRIRLKYGAHHRTELVYLIQRERCAAVISEMRAENERLLARVKQGGIPLLKEILDGIDEAVIVVDERERIRYANSRAAKLFGCPPGTLDGALHAHLLPEELRAGHENNVRQFLEQPERHEMGDHAHAWARHRSGKVFQIHACLTPLHTPDGPLVMCAIRDSELPRRYLDRLPPGSG